MEINAQNIENIDDHFSSELLSLMGEWVTYRAFDSKQGLADDYPLREMFEKSLLWDDTDIFGIMGHYGPLNNQKHFWVASMLLEYGIVKTEAPHLKSNVSYDDVRITFLKNIGVNRESIFINFAKTLCYEKKNKKSFRTTYSRYEHFTVDVGCKPLVEAFEAENYLNSYGESYCWTPRIRPLFEYSRDCNKVIHICSEEKFIQTLPSDYLTSLDTCYTEQGYTAALQMLKNHPSTQNSHLISEANKPAPHLILNTLYPKIDTDMTAPINLPWFGEANTH